MKSFIFTIALLLLVAVAFPQSNFRQLSKVLQNQPDFFASELTQKTITLYLKEKTPTDEIAKVLDELHTLRVMSMTTNKNSNVYDEAEKMLNLNNYMVLSMANTDQIIQQILIKEQNNIITDLLIINKSDSHFSLIELKGNIELEHIASLNDALNIKGLEALNGLNAANSTTENTYVSNSNNQRGKSYVFSRSNIDAHRQKTPVIGFQPWSINNNENPFAVVDVKQNITVYDKFGQTLLKANQPSVYVNGFQSPLVSLNGKYGIDGIKSECIQSINVVKEQASTGDDVTNPSIEIMLKGDCDEVFIICEGTLYFGQNGLLQSIDIDDDCAPHLLVDCEEKPLNEIKKVHPSTIRSIELSANPRNCEGILEGEYVVLETVK